MHSYADTVMSLVCSDYSARGKLAETKNSNMSAKIYHAMALSQPRSVVQMERQRMQQLQQAEVSRAQAAQAKNELEAYIISTQGRLDDDEEVQAVTTDKQRQTFQKDLSKVEDWLYDQGEHEQASVFRCIPAARIHAYVYMYIV